MEALPARSETRHLLPSRLRLQVSSLLTSTDLRRSWVTDKKSDKKTNKIRQRTTKANRKPTKTYKSITTLNNLSRRTTRPNRHFIQTATNTATARNKRRQRLRIIVNMFKWEMTHKQNLTMSSSRSRTQNRTKRTYNISHVLN